MRRIRAVAAVVILLAGAVDFAVESNSSSRYLPLIVFAGALILGGLLVTAPRIPGELRRRVIARTLDGEPTFVALRGPSLRAWLEQFRDSSQKSRGGSLSVVITLEDSGLRFWNSGTDDSATIRVLWRDISTVEITPRQRRLGEYPLLRIVTPHRSVDMLVTNPQTLGVFIARRRQLERLVTSARNYTERISAS